MKTAELTGALLDYWVARAENKNAFMYEGVCFTGPMPGVGIEYKPSERWGQCGPLIEKWKVELDRSGTGWYADIWACGGALGDTPLQAICRAVVRAAFGDEVEEVAVC
jgi:hypothetical protein